MNGIGGLVKARRPANDPVEAAEREAIANENVDAIDSLREAGAIVGYDALVAETAVPPVPIWYSGVERDSHIEISGPSGHGKTTLAILLALARANPTGAAVMLLGRPLEPGEAGQYVVIVEEENGKFSLRKKAEMGCGLLGLPVKETLDRIVFIVRKRVTAGDAMWSKIERLGREGKVSAVLVDSRARVLRKGESNKEEDQAEIANQLHGMVEACKAPVFVISHTRKGEKGGAPSEIEDVSGSVQRAGGADVLLLVTAKKRSNGEVETSTIKFAKLRDSLEDWPAPVTYSIGKDAEGELSLSMSVTAARDDRPLTDRVLEVIAAHDGITKNKIRTALKECDGRDVNPKNLEDAISALFDDRAITKQQAMVAGKLRHLFVARPA